MRLGSRSDATAAHTRLPRTSTSSRPNWTVSSFSTRRYRYRVLVSGGAYASSFTVPIVRRGPVADLDELLRLRAVLFETMEIDFERAEWEAACRQILVSMGGPRATSSRRSRKGTTVRSLPAASAPSAGGCQALVTPRALRGYIGSMSTDRDWRRHGLGRQILGFLIELLHARGHRDRTSRDRGSHPVRAGSPSKPPADAPGTPTRLSPDHGRAADTFLV